VSPRTNRQRSLCATPCSQRAICPPLPTFTDCSGKRAAYMHVLSAAPTLHIHSHGPFILFLAHTFLGLLETSETSIPYRARLPRLMRIFFFRGAQSWMEGLSAGTRLIAAIPAIVRGLASRPFWRRSHSAARTGRWMSVPCTKRA
jgi:hypothetical protein